MKIIILLMLLSLMSFAQLDEVVKIKVTPENYGWIFILKTDKHEKLLKEKEEYYLIDSNRVCYVRCCSNYSNSKGVEVYNDEGANISHRIKLKFKSEYKKSNSKSPFVYYALYIASDKEMDVDSLKWNDFEFTEEITYKLAQLESKLAEQGYFK